MMDERYESVREFARFYENLQKMIQGGSNIFKVDYMNTISYSIDTMKEFAMTKWGVVFNGDNIDWEQTFPDAYHRKNMRDWLATRGARPE